MALQPLLACVDGIDAMRPFDCHAIRHEAVRPIYSVQIRRSEIRKRKHRLPVDDLVPVRHIDLLDCCTARYVVHGSFDLIFIVRDVRDETRDQKIAEHVIQVGGCVKP